MHVHIIKFKHGEVFYFKYYSKEYIMRFIKNDWFIDSWFEVIDCDENQPVPLLFNIGDEQIKYFTKKGSFIKLGRVNPKCGCTRIKKLLLLCPYEHRYI